MADYVLPESVVAIGRAGAGVNNIPHAEYAKRGVVVFNSPGANANAVKELVITALLLSCRKIIEGIKWVNSQNNAEGGVAKIVEKGKAQFVGGEISGKTLGVVGLGAIGRKVAVAANALGMNIVGYDPFSIRTRIWESISKSSILWTKFTKNPTSLPFIFPTTQTQKA